MCWPSRAGAFRRRRDRPTSRARVAPPLAFLGHPNGRPATCARRLAVALNWRLRGREPPAGCVHLQSNTQSGAWLSFVTPRGLGCTTRAAVPQRPKTAREHRAQNSAQFCPVRIQGRVGWGVVTQAAQAGTIAVPSANTNAAALESLAAREPATKSHAKRDGRRPARPQGPSPSGRVVWAFGPVAFQALQYRA